MTELKLTRYRDGLMFCETKGCFRNADWVISPLATEDNEFYVCNTCLFGLGNTCLFGFGSSVG